MRRKWFSLAILSLVGFLSACSTSGNTTPKDDDGGDDDIPEIVDVVGISLNTEQLHLTVDDTYRLAISVLPYNATDTSYYIDSNKHDIATVDQNGLVTAIAPGECRITATSMEGFFKAYCNVTVRPKEEQPNVTHVTGIRISDTAITLKEGEEQQLTYTITPDNASDKSVTWTSLNPNVATVSGGLVHAVSEGVTSISVMSKDGNYSSTCRVTVNKDQQQPDEGGGEEEQLPPISYIKVFADKTQYENVYAWINGSNNQNIQLTGGWPGKAMTSYDDDWLTYDFIGYTSLNIIFNKSGSQTSDLYISSAGYYWCTNGRLYNKLPSDADEENPDLPQGNFEIVKSAADYTELPAVKNYNKGQVINPYRGTRLDYREETIYFAMTTRFYDGDPSNNKNCWDGKNNDGDPEWRGDFKGLIEKMDYIKALGFTAIWITPVVKNASGYDYHGYHAINFSQVDPRYESNDAKFSDLIATAHSKDMKIILDVVFNHTSNYGEENLFPMFNYDPGTNATYSGLNPGLYYNHVLPSNYASIGGGRQFDARTNALKEATTDQYNIYHHEKSMGYEQYIEQTGSLAGDCVDLNTENPTVANYIVDKYGDFIRMGVDGFRVDTVKHISRLTLNKYINPGLMAIAHKCGNDNFFMFGEVCNRERGVWNHNVGSDSACFYTWKESKDYAWGDRKTNEKSTLENWNDNVNPAVHPTINNVYLNSGYTYHEPDHSKKSDMNVIDFAMHWNFQYARDAYNVAKNNDEVYNDATYNVVYVDSHDYSPDGVDPVRYNMGTDAWKENLSLMFTFRGVPCLYYGSEVEFQKGCVIDKYQDLGNSGRAYYGDYLSGSVTATGFGNYTASGTVNNTLNYTLAKHIQKLNKIRLKVPALSKGQYSAQDNMSFVRRYTKGNIDSLAVVAISNGATFTGLPNGNYVDLVTGTRKTVSNGSLNISVSGQGNLAVYVLENSYTGTLSQIN